MRYLFGGWTICIDPWSALGRPATHGCCTVNYNDRAPCLEPPNWLQVTCAPSSCPSPCKACDKDTDTCQEAAFKGTCTTTSRAVGHCSAGECKVRQAQGTGCLLASARRQGPSHAGVVSSRLESTPVVINSKSMPMLLQVTCNTTTCPAP